MIPHIAGQMAALCRESQPAKAIMAELALKHRETCQATGRFRTAPARAKPQGRPESHKEGQGPAMIPSDCKRLEEVDFPIAEVSRNAASSAYRSADREQPSEGIT